jgi:hypothetical protein
VVFLFLEALSISVTTLSPTVGGWKDTQMKLLFQKLI